MLFETRCTISELVSQACSPQPATKPGLKYEFGGGEIEFRGYKIHRVKTRCLVLVAQMRGIYTPPFNGGEKN